MQLFIVPEQDLETLTIVKLLRREGKKVLVAKQRYGASWDRLEENFLEEIKKLPKGSTITTVKLSGTPDEFDKVEIERYKGWGDTPLETISKKLGVSLTREQELVVQNTKGKISALKKFGASDEEIQKIRALDRKAQGITADEEAEALRAWGKREFFGDLTVVRLQGRSVCAPVTDRFFAEYKNILIFGEDGETNFFGEAEMCLLLKEKFPTFKDPAGKESRGWVRIEVNGNESFWGGYPNQEEVFAYATAMQYREVSCEEFVSQRDKMPAELAEFLTMYSCEEYHEMGTRLFLSYDNKSGFGLNPGGYLISVFSTDKGRGRGLVLAAYNQGAKALDCLGEHLKNLYGQFGFRVLDSYPWSDEFAPKNWDYAKFGRPDYYEMVIVR